MLKKYRIHELSKDLNVPSKELVGLLKSYFDNSYSHMTSLSEKELDTIFEHYTRKNEVDSFDDYFAPLKEKIDSNTTNIQNIFDSYSKKIEKDKKSNDLKNQKKKLVHKSLENKPSKSSESEDKPVIIKKQEFKVINTRSDNVNIDKYDKKYENIASQNKLGNSDYSTKQKIVKSPKNKKFRKHESEFDRLKRIEAERKSKPITISIPDNIVVRDLALKLKATSSEVIKKLIKLGVIASVNDVIDFDTASLVSMDFNAKVEKQIVQSIEDLAIEEVDDSEDQLEPRDPVVAVMGHVDHGKTSILDYIRKANVVSHESGGITQHIGAYKAKFKDRSITFLDTPGHEAFVSMRARGAKATDVAVLVIAADDGIMPQTVEAINHAKEAKVSIIVSINKIDKPGADIEKVKQQLMNYNLVPEEWGGDIICVPVSAKTGAGIDDLLESILLVADMKELKANPNRRASGVVIESKVENGRGVVSTLLIMNGSLHVGDIVVAGTSMGKVRSLNDELGRKLPCAKPSDAVEITGLDVSPQAGEQFNVVLSEKLAHELVSHRKVIRDNERMNSTQKVSADNFLDVIKQRNMKDLKIIIKADTNGSSEALKESLEKLSNDEILIKPIYCGVGDINESDIILASTSKAIVVGFNVKANSDAKNAAYTEKVDIKLYKVIYDCINDISDLMKEMLIPEIKEIHLGTAECRKIFNIKNVGVIAGCYVTDGVISRNDMVHVIREKQVIASDKIVSLKKYKDDVKEATQGFECGILLENYSEFLEGDKIETYSIEK